MLRAKFINESEKLGPKQFGEEFCMNLIETEMPYLMSYKPEYFDGGDRNYPEETIGYGDDEIFEKWDYVALNWDIAEEYSNGLSMLICKEPDGEIGIKFYSDTVSFDGYKVDDEYINYMDPIPLKEMDEERFELILDQMKEHWGWDEDEEINYSDDMLTK